MSLCVVGSVALDTIETPLGKAEGIFGGSAVYFSLAARLFSDVRMVGVVGLDFPQQHVETLRRSGIDLGGLQRKPGKTFRWWGRYSADMNQRETVKVDLNVFGDFQPEIPPAYTDSEFVFLANGSPATQAAVLSQMRRPRFTMVDTMDLWIRTTRDDLMALLERVDGLIVNDSEARLLTNATSTVAAARDIMDLGPRIVVVKKGEHGAIMVSAGEYFAVPAFPCPDVKDPTGAGDSFAGGLMGWLASEGSADPKAIRMGMACGTVLASFGVEDFGPSRLVSLTRDDVERRMSEFRAMLSF